MQQQTNLHTQNWVALKDVIEEIEGCCAGLLYLFHSLNEDVTQDMIDGFHQVANESLEEFQKILKFLDGQENIIMGSHYDKQNQEEAR